MPFDNDNLFTEYIGMPIKKTRKKRIRIQEHDQNESGYETQVARINVCSLALNSLQIFKGKLSTNKFMQNAVQSELTM